jgi:hypothetical protein
MSSCLPGTGGEGLSNILFFPANVSVVPMKHSQFAKVPDSKSMLGGQVDWLYALERKHTIKNMQATDRVAIIKRVK